MSLIKVIGIGSPFGGDKIGWLAIDKIVSAMHKTGINQDAISFEKADRPGTLLLEMIKDIDTVILIDAIDNKQNAGQILQLDKLEIQAAGQNLSCHNIGVSETLQLGAVLGDIPDNILLFGICIDATSPVLPDDRLIQELANCAIKTLNENALKNNAGCTAS